MVTAFGFENNLPIIFPVAALILEEGDEVSCVVRHKGQIMTAVPAVEQLRQRLSQRGKWDTQTYPCPELKLTQNDKGKLRTNLFGLYAIPFGDLTEKSYTAGELSYRRGATVTFIIIGEARVVSNVNDAEIEGIETYTGENVSFVSNLAPVARFLGRYVTPHEVFGYPSGLSDFSGTLDTREWEVLAGRIVKEAEQRIAKFKTWWTRIAARVIHPDVAPQKFVEAFPELQMVVIREHFDILWRQSEETVDLLKEWYTEWARQAAVMMREYGTLVIPMPANRKRRVWIGAKWQEKVAKEDQQLYAEWERRPTGENARVALIDVSAQELLEIIVMSQERVLRQKSDEWQDSIPMGGEGLAASKNRDPVMMASSQKALSESDEDWATTVGSMATKYRERIEKQKENAARKITEQNLTKPQEDVPSPEPKQRKRVKVTVNDVTGGVLEKLQTKETVKAPARRKARTIAKEPGQKSIKKQTFDDGTAA